MNPNGAKEGNGLREEEEKEDRMEENPMKIKETSENASVLQVGKGSIIQRNSDPIEREEPRKTFVEVKSRRIYKKKRDISPPRCLSDDYKMFRTFRREALLDEYEMIRQIAREQEEEELRLLRVKQEQRRLKRKEEEEKEFIAKQEELRLKREEEEKEFIAKQEKRRLEREEKLRQAERRREQERIMDQYKKWERERKYKEWREEMSKWQSYRQIAENRLRDAELDIVRSYSYGKEAKSEEEKKTKKKLEKKMVRMLKKLEQKKECVCGRRAYCPSRHN